MDYILDVFKLRHNNLEHEDHIKDFEMEWNEKQKEM